MKRVLGWKLDRDEVRDLLGRFLPAYPDIVADHVTLAFRPPPDTALPAERWGEIVGQADDGAGVQALIVRIGGSTDRPTGGTYHITWSLDRAAGRKAVESNDVIASLGWRPCDPVRISLRPAWF